MGYTAICVLPITNAGMKLNAMFWGAIIHMYLAVKKLETVTLGIKIETDENWWGVLFHIVLGSILFWIYRK